MLVWMMVWLTVVFSDEVVSMVHAVFCCLDWIVVWIFICDSKVAIKTEILCVCNFKEILKVLGLDVQEDWI